jgi:hypothetical protein
MIPESVPAQAIWSLPPPRAYRDNAETLEHGRLPRCCLPQDRAYRKNAGALGEQAVPHYEAVPEDLWREGRSQHEIWVGSIVWATTATSSADRVSRSISSRRRVLNASIVLAAW